VVDLTSAPSPAFLRRTAPPPRLQQAQRAGRETQRGDQPAYPPPPAARAALLGLPARYQAVYLRSKIRLRSGIVNDLRGVRQFLRERQLG
jgi:hypothetical protein